MHVGIFGGTFDPIHAGHLIVAERCREEAGLDEVWFLPSYAPPHKEGVAITRFEHRCEMVTLATAGALAPPRGPLERDLPTPSYTAETLKQLILRHPDEQFSLILGGDSVHDLNTWYQPQRVVAQAGIIAVGRPGWTMPSVSELAKNLNVPESTIRLNTVECPLIDISSRDIRKRVQDGKTIRYLVPRAVEVFIHERKLYVS